MLLSSTYSQVPKSDSLSDNSITKINELGSNASLPSRTIIDFGFMIHLLWLVKTRYLTLENGSLQHYFFRKDTCA